MEKIIIEMKEQLNREIKHLQLVTGKALNENDKAKRQELLADVIKTSERIGIIRSNLSSLELLTK